jgi:hypothetical protein
VPQELIKYNRHDVDKGTMETTVVQTRVSQKSRTTQANGTLVRRCAIATATLYSIIVVAMISAAPELLKSEPLLFLWTFTMIAAAATYIAGQVLTQRTSNQP